MLELLQTHPKGIRRLIHRGDSSRRVVRGALSMNIAVLLKQVPDTTAKITVADGRVDENDVSKWSMSPYDEYALESALQLSAAIGGTITVVTAGPDRCNRMLTDAAAVGADNLVRIDVADLSALDSTQVQSLLAAAVQNIGADVVFCGKQASDTNAGSTGPGVAELMDAACVTLVSEVTADGNGFSAMRQNSSGSERIAVTAPCIFAFDKGTIEMRRPNVRGIMMAKKKQIEVISAADLGVDIGAASVSISGHTPPAQKAAGQKFEGADSVSVVVGKLRDEANVI